MKPYIENSLGEKIELNSINRKLKAKVAKELADLKYNTDTQFEIIENTCYDIVKYNHPNMTREEYEASLDYMEQKYGFAELYEILGYVIKDVFTQVGGDKQISPYLEMKRKEGQTQE